MKMTSKQNKNMVRQPYILQSNNYNPLYPTQYRDIIPLTGDRNSFGTQSILWLLQGYTYNCRKRY